MPTFLTRTIMASLVAAGVTTATSGVTLANFIPRIENLPQQCFEVYTRQINGCQAGDFPTKDNPNARCSENCVRGLVAIQRDVQQGCAGVTVEDITVIGVFMLGKGVENVCPGITVVTASPSSQAQQQTSTQEQEQPPQTSQAQPSSTPASSTGGIIVDTTVPTNAATSIAPPSMSFVPPENTAPAQPPPAAPAAPAPPEATDTATAIGQKSNADSGGGSPFDVVATGSSSQLASLRGIAIGTILGAFALICAM